MENQQSLQTPFQTSNAGDICNPKPIFYFAREAAAY